MIHSHAVVKTTQSESLERKIQNLIAANGPISIADYMSICLCDPELGYYNTMEPFGSDGDFITAPEISQMFGELIGAWCIEVWKGLGKPSSIFLLELGPGSGILMSDMLRVADKNPEFLRAVQVHLVESSPLLIERQKELLRSLPVAVHWHQNLKSVPEGLAILIANEFLDALPIRQFVFDRNHWHERVVGVNEQGNLEYGLRPSARELANEYEIAKTASRGDVFETSPGAMAISDEISNRLIRQDGVALLIDYGYLKSSFGDTLQAVSRHKFMNLFDSPGKSDLTAHVNFQALERIARATGANCHGPITQGEFLLNLGLLERAGILGHGKSKSVQDGIRLEVERLAGPEQMGTLFKVLAISKRDFQLPGFETA